MAKLEVAVRCPTCGGILLFFEPVSLGSGLTCDTCHTEFPFSADRVVPESVLAAEAGGGGAVGQPFQADVGRLPQGAGPSGPQSSAQGGPAEPIVFTQRPVWPLWVLVGAAVLIGLLIGYWSFRGRDRGQEIADADREGTQSQPAKAESPTPAAPGTTVAAPPATVAPSSGPLKPPPPPPIAATDEPRPIPPPPPVVPPGDGKNEPPVLPPPPDGPGGLVGSGSSPGTTAPGAPVVVMPGGGGANINLNLNLGGQDPARDAVPGVEWMSALDDATGEEWGLWTDNTGTGGAAPRQAHFRIRTTNATTERVTVELNPDSDLTVVAPGAQFVLQGGNAAQEVRVQGAGNAAFGGAVSKPSFVRTAVTRDNGERFAGPNIQIVILNNALPGIVFMPMTTAATPIPPPDCVQISNGSRGIGFRVVATQRPVSPPGVVVGFGAAPGPGVAAGPCLPAALTLDAANYNHGRIVFPPLGGGTPGTFTITYAPNGFAANAGFTQLASPAINVRNAAPSPGPTPRTVTPWIAGCGPSQSLAETLARRSVTRSTLAAMLVSPTLFLAAPNPSQTEDASAALVKDRPRRPRLLGFVRFSPDATSPGTRPASSRLLGFVPLSSSGPTPNTRRAEPRLLGYVWWSNRSTQPTQPIGPGLDSVVTIDTVTGECRTKVPNVVKQTLREARKLLKKRLLVADVPNQCARDDDYVKAQSIEADSKVACDTHVKLDPVVTKVPNVVGMTLEQAYKTLNQKEGFYVKSKGKSFCRVTKQEPAAGEELARCETVRLCCKVQVPQLVGMDFSQALQKLTELDLQGQSRGSAFQGDVVFTMTPTAGTEVEVESLVALTPGVAVPDLRGPISEAQRLLVQSGLLGYLKHVQSIPSATTGMGTEVVVDWQSVAPQTVVPRSKRITVSGYRYVPVFTQFPVQPQRNISITLGGFSGQTSGGCGGSASAGSRGGKGCPLPSVCGPAGGRGGMGGGMF